MFRFWYVLIFILLPLNIHDEGYSRNTSCALSLITTVLLTFVQSVIVSVMRMIRSLHVNANLQQFCMNYIVKDIEEVEDTQGEIRIRKSKNSTMAKRKRTKGPTAIYKTLHIKLKME